MPKEIEPIVLPDKWNSPNDADKSSPRLLIKNLTKEELPIKGGWGYNSDNAVIIDKDDPINPEGIPFNGHSIMHAFVEHRMFIETIIFRDKENQYTNVSLQMLGSRLTNIDNKKFDVLNIEVTATHPNGEVHSYISENWFDITSFFGKSGEDRYPNHSNYNPPPPDLPPGWKNNISPSEVRKKSHEAFESSNYIEAKNLALEFLEYYRDGYMSYVAGQCYRFEDDYINAIKWLQESVNVDSDKTAPPVFLALGIAYQLNEEFNPAVTNLQRAIALDNKYTAAYNSLALTYRLMGLVDDALETYTKALEINNELIKENNESNIRLAMLSVTINFNIGRCHQELGNISKAKEFIHTSISLIPDGEEYPPAFEALAELEEHPDAKPSDRTGKMFSNFFNVFSKKK